MFIQSQALSTWAASALLILSVSTQTCYYPSGDSVTQEPVAECGDTKVCCPLNWECMSNGLCYDPAADIYGRYSCTSKDWVGCPNFCTTNFGSSNGNQAVLQCPQHNNQWCCDANRESFNCCTQTGTDFFELEEGVPIATITSVSFQISTPSASLDSGPLLSSSSFSAVYTATSVLSLTLSITSSIILSTNDFSPGVSQGPSTSALKSISISTASTSPSPSNSTQSGISNPTPNKSSRLGLILGFSIGALGGVILIATINGLVRFVKRRRSDRNISTEEIRAAEANGETAVLPSNRHFTSKWIAFPFANWKAGRQQVSSPSLDGETSRNRLSELDSISLSVVPGHFELPGNSSKLELAAPVAELESGNLNRDSLNRHEWLAEAEHEHISMP